MWIPCFILHLNNQLPASVAQLDAHPTGDQEFEGSTPTGSETFFCGGLIMKYFLWSFFQLSVSDERMHNAGA